jgi:predicted acetyltransferase
MPIDQIAEKHGVSIEYLEEQLNKGLQHEKEHTDSDEVATSIALHHLAERPDYYEELEKMKLEDGGEVSISDEDYEFTIGGDENLGKAIKQDGVIVGGIAYDEDEQQIYGIVIKNKFRKKGVAKRAIKALFDKNPDLKEVYVRAVPESKGFWKKIGTDFDNYNEDAGLWEGYVKRFEDGGDVDLFEEMDNLPEEVQAVLRKYSTEDETYTNAESMLSDLESLGYTFEYGLDAVPYNLRKIDISEDNSPEDVEIADFLNQQKYEAQMVMTCDDSKIYKAMICKTKCEIADKRMSETENPEELNAWNSYKNIWNECLESILNDEMDKYKVGGKTCGCGCGSIYSKGGMFSKGGLAYGNSHDKGGMPMKVKSTGQNIEIEGGEGVVNKRSMQSTKKVEFQGQKMTPCEAVSKINQMGGGVKIKCEEVADIIAEDGNF